MYDMKFYRRWSIIQVMFLVFFLASPSEARNITKIIVHHSATDQGDVDSFRKHHMETKGWDDVGYHFVIKRDGTLQYGRPLFKQGAHAKGRNWNSIGICLVGKDQFNGQQHLQLKKLIRDLYMHHDIASIERHHEKCPGEGLGAEWFK